MIKRLDVPDDGGAKWCKAVQKQRKRQKVTYGFCERVFCIVLLGSKWMSSDEGCCYR